MARCEEVPEKQIASPIRLLLNCVRTGMLWLRLNECHGSEQEPRPPLPGKEARAEDGILGKGKEEGWQAWHHPGPQLLAVFDTWRAHWASAGNEDGESTPSRPGRLATSEHGPWWVSLHLGKLPQW